MRITAAILAGTLAASSGCASDRAARQGVRDFSRGDFAGAADAFSPSASASVLHENSLLDSARLGMAALAAGDVDRSVRALGAAYRLLESGGVNDEARIFAATVLHEGVKVYKGEPFEQAMTYTALAWANALKGDWENVRVCARASVRRLADFRQAGPGASDRFEREGVSLVESNFALGYLLEGIADRATGERDDALDRAAAINPGLRPLVESLRAGRVNCLVVVDYGRGPRKTAYGEDHSLTRWEPRERAIREIAIDSTALPALRVPAAADVNSMSADHRWNNLENARKFKSGLGTALVVGGVVTAGSSERKETQIAGVAAAATGVILKLLSSADVRYNELLPSEVFVAGLELPTHGATVSLFAGDSAGAAPAIPCIPGSATSPSIVYLRVLPGAQPPVYPVTSWGYATAQHRRDADEDARDAWRRD